MDTSKTHEEYIEELKDTTLQVAGFEFDSVVDGPGMRSVIFLQGCHANCPGCQNPETHDPKGGTTMSIREILNRIKEHEGITKAVTISGGEPLEQLYGLADLLEVLHSEGYDLALFTGKDMENICIRNLQGVLFSKLHYIKTGPFEIENRTLEKKFVGSSNQQFYEIKGYDKDTGWILDQL